MSQGNDEIRAFVKSLKEMINSRKMFSLMSSPCSRCGGLQQQLCTATGRQASQFTVTRRLHEDGLVALHPEHCIPLTAAHRWQHLQWFVKNTKIGHLINEITSCSLVTSAVEELLETKGYLQNGLASISPYLSPIEHAWNALGRRLAARSYPLENTRQVKQLLLHEEWKELLDNLVISIAVTPTSLNHKQLRA
ncbi:hypothetical protein TNCV_2089091 [Trichonephila clavipes]|nr:hypothetical protein TNCV_2089091 [Trichonephila clavipes]